MVLPRSSVDEVIGLVCADQGPPSVVVTGWVGTGRTALLAAVGRSLRARGRTVIETRIAPDGLPVDWHDGGTTSPRMRGLPPFGPVDGAHETPLTARRAAAAMAASLVPRNAVVLIDDAQWMDRDTAAVLEALAHQLAGTGVRCVCAIAVPCPEPLATAGGAALARLRAARLVTSVRVPALDADATARAVRPLVGGIPSTELVAHVRARSRGIGAAAVDVASSLKHAGGVRLVSGHAYLVPDPPDDLADDTDATLLAHVRRLGPRSWRAACTVAALEPAGPALVALLATALETSVGEALVRLQDLKTAGVLHRASDGGWRFLVPILGDRLRAALGPYERRMLAALVVRAVWQGEARLSWPELADLVATAGRLLPAEQAHAELVSAGDRALDGPARRTARWWRAAADLAKHEDDRVRARLRHTRACKSAGDLPGAIAGARALLDDGSALPERTRHELFFMLVVSLHRDGALDELEAVGNGTALGEGDEAIRAICRVMALLLLGRFGPACSLLARTHATWAARPFTREIGEMVYWVGELFGGRLRFDPSLLVGASAQGADPVHARFRAYSAIACMVAFGDLGRGREVARMASLPESELYPPHRAAFALLEGRPEAHEMARRTLVDHRTLGFELSRASCYQLFANLSLIKGQLTDARQMIAAAHTEVPAFSYVLEAEEASVEFVLGAVDAARVRVEAALDRAQDNGLLVGTDLLLSLLIAIDRRSGDVSGARARSRELDEVDAALQNPRTAMHAAFGRALAHDDASAAAECLRLGQENGQRYEGANLARRLAGARLTEPDVLVDVYEFYGSLDALLGRAWTRKVMKDRGVPVPGRAETKAENERLLGQLLSEGLTNRQIATLLYSTEKSVEGRLGRLFSRTGYRSRIELATALLNGTYAA